jgi:hypothetical protein
MDLRDIGLDGVNWIDVAQDRKQCREGSCEQGIEPSGSMKCWDILERLHNWQLLKNDSAP